MRSPIFYKHFLRIFLMLLLLVMPKVLSAKVWSADDVPMVHLQDARRYVCDPEELMSAADRDSADAVFYRLHHECGIQTVFIVVPNVKNADCFRMAQDVGNHYGVGTKKDRRGLVVVVATEDRKYFIAPGKGLEGDLTDIECNDIGKACIRKYMKEDDLDRAVLSTANALYSKFKTGKTGVKEVDNDEDVTSDDLLAIILFLLFCFGAPAYALIRWILEQLGLVKPRPKRPGSRRRHDNDDDFFPPFIFGGGGGGFSGGSSGGSFGGGSFGGGGAGGGW